MSQATTITAPQVLDELKGMFGERMSVRESDRLIYHRDLFPGAQLTVREGVIANRPDAIVWPETVQDIAALMRIAAANRLPVIPYGAGSSVVGGTIAIRGGVICDLKRMNRIVTIDERSLLMTAEAGIVGEDLERALNTAGYTLGHFPSSIYCSTLGGWLAARSAGQMSTKYGKIEDMVVSMEAVLPSGNIIHTKQTPRSATGPDIDQLLIGSEGTLAIITRATLRIHRLPEVRKFTSATFGSVEEGLEAVRLIMRSGARPSVVRLYDEVDTALALSSLGLEANGNLLIVGFEGRERIVDTEMKVAAGFLAKGHPLGSKPGEWWYDHRYKISYKQSVILSGPRMVLDTCEVAGTWSNILDVYDAVKKALDGYVTVLAHFSHAYAEGINIYFSFIGDSGATPPPQFYEEMWRRALDAVADAGGSVSHHHGVGLLKAPWMRRELGGLLDVFARLKKELDPNNVLNPGKMGLS
jgi:alkyldihydroxyacetonephosphate synthase